LGLVFCSLTLIWLSAYAVVVARAGDVLRRPAIRRVLDAATGLVLTALGLRLATERR
jgi:threonine/homoserine/homoserine lactone efflux protein